MSKHRAARQPRPGSRRVSSRSRTGRKAGLVAFLALPLSAAAVTVLDDLNPRPTSSPTAAAADVRPSTVPGPARSPTTDVSPGRFAPRQVVTPAASATAPAAVSERGPGTFRTARATETPTSGSTSYRVEVERGLPFDVDQVASFVQATLADDRGWASRHSLTRVDGDSDLRIVVATPRTADSLCAPLDTGGRLSCRNGSNVVINAWRWQFGADSYLGQLEAYRRYVVNHETGHALGYGHVGCPAAGELAPVMLQQTKGLEGCVANPWPARVDLVDH